MGIEEKVPPFDVPQVPFVGVGVGGVVVAVVIVQLYDLFGVVGIPVPVSM
jgi:hypothetical protein